MPARSCFNSLMEIAETSDAEVWHALGECFNGGRGTEVDREEAMRWFERAAEAGHNLFFPLQRAERVSFESS